MSILIQSMLTRGFIQTLANKVNVSLRRCDASFGFLLKRVQNIYSFRIANRVYGSPRVSAVLGNNLQHRCSAKPSQWFG
jgi:hypothetical protein